MRVVSALEDEEVSLLAPDCAIRRAQEIVRRYVPEGQSLVDELIEERREHGSGALDSSTPDQSGALTEAYVHERT